LFSCAGDQIQDFAHARQVPYCWSTSPTLCPPVRLSKAKSGRFWVFPGYLVHILTYQTLLKDAVLKLWWAWDLLKRFLKISTRLSFLEESLFLWKVLVFFIDFSCESPSLLHRLIPESLAVHLGQVNRKGGEKTRQQLWRFGRHHWRPLGHTFLKQQSAQNLSLQTVSK
jgi:hypothetical protein